MANVVQERAQSVTAPAVRPCRACGAPLTGPYCAACGQKVLPPVTLRSILWHVLQTVLPDGTLGTTARELLLRPGDVIQDWLRGRTRPYTGPFAFLSIAFSLVAFITIVQLRVNFGGGGGAYFVFGLAPLVLVLAGRLLFLRDGRNLAAHVVANTYLVGEDLLLSIPLFLLGALGPRALHPYLSWMWYLILFAHARGLAQAAGGGWRTYVGALLTVAAGAAAVIHVAMVGITGVLAELGRVLR